MNPKKHYTETEKKYIKFFGDVNLLVMISPYQTLRDIEDIHFKDINSFLNLFELNKNKKGYKLT